MVCANILSREGYNVCLAEKNSRPGGCLQTFTREGTVFDTGMHYIGGMDEGGMLHRIFGYMGLTGKLRLIPLDKDGFDIVRLGGKEYPFAMGYDNFVETLARQFPGERPALETYAASMREISQTVDLCNPMRPDTVHAKYLSYLSTNYHRWLHELTTDKTLAAVLAGNSLLYAGVRQRTPLYLPMMILSTYLQGACRFAEGSSQLATLLAESARDSGATLLTNAAVTRLIRHSRRLTAAEINGSELAEAKHFIAAIHPLRVLELLDDTALKPAYVRRIRSLAGSSGMFSLYLRLDRGFFPYLNRNYFIHNTGNVWSAEAQGDSCWPASFMVHFTPCPDNPARAGALSALAFMQWEEVLPWADTITERRGSDYRDFKQRKADKLLALLEEHFPGVRVAAGASYTSTPLTYRDYTGTWQGSAYGIQKDCNNAIGTVVLPATHISNLWLTGQNTNTHGAVGVSISAILTCSEILGKKYMLGKLCSGQT